MQKQLCGGSAPRQVESSDSHNRYSQHYDAPLTQSHITSTAREIIEKSILLTLFNSGPQIFLFFKSGADFLPLIRKEKQQSVLTGSTGVACNETAGANYRKSAKHDKRRSKWKILTEVKMSALNIAEFNNGPIKA